ncbi:glycoside hydrolase family 5 protein [Streptomyces aculeolatus]
MTLPLSSTATAGPAPTGSSKAATAAVEAEPPSPLKVDGNKLVDGTGTAVQLRGVTRMGMEWPCAQGWGLVDGPLDDAAVTAVTSWNVDVVRIHLNEHCWLGTSDIKPEYGGAPYQAMVKDYVDKLQNAGLYVIIDMHWSAPAGQQATTQQKMADAAYAPDYWKSVATTFKDYPGVIFDLFNEPHDISWECWRDGCTVDGWEAVGYQDLVDTVRATGATQPIVLTCNGWGNQCPGWLDYKPTDPQNNLIAGVHIYDYTGCNVQSCWDSDIAPLAAEVPVITGEFGDNDCNHDWSDGFMSWLDEQGISWTAHSFYPGDCGAPGLITDWDGTPSTYGQGVFDRLAAGKESGS